MEKQVLALDLSDDSLSKANLASEAGSHAADDLPEDLLALVSGGDIITPPLT